MRSFTFGISFCVALLLSTTATGQNSRTNPDSETFDPDGTAHITRVVPMPATVSPEAQKWLKEIEGDSPHDATLAERRGPHRSLAAVAVG